MVPVSKRLCLEMGVSGNGVAVCLVRCLNIYSRVSVYKFDGGRY